MPKSLIPWPANSPDMNPMDFSIWNLYDWHLRRLWSTRGSKPTSESALKADILQVWEEMRGQYDWSKITNEFVKRVNHLIVKNGGHVETYDVKKKAEGEGPDLRRSEDEGLDHADFFESEDENPWESEDEDRLFRPSMF